jgi:hypothetical protein
MDRPTLESKEPEIDESAIDKMIVDAIAYLRKSAPYDGQRSGKVGRSFMVENPGIKLDKKAADEIRKVYPSIRGECGSRLDALCFIGEMYGCDPQSVRNVLNNKCWIDSNYDAYDWDYEDEMYKYEATERKPKPYAEAYIKRRTARARQNGSLVHLSGIRQ